MATKLETYVKRFGGYTIFYVIFLMVFLSVQTVKWERNEHLVNTTDEYNNTVSKAELYYTQRDLVPVRNFGENSVNHFSMEDVVIILVVSIIYIAISKSKKDIRDAIEEAKAKEKIQKMLSKNPDVDEFVVLQQSFLQKISIDDSEPAPLSRWVFAEVKFNDRLGDNAGYKYIAFDLDPFTNYLSRTCVTEYEPIGLMAVCHNCGAFPNVKIRTPVGLKELTDKFSAMLKK